MSKLQSLVLLISSMTHSEKKAFSLLANRKGSKKDYLELYDTIVGNKTKDATIIRVEFLKKRPGSSMETTVRYLFDLIMKLLLDQREMQDSNFLLFNKILKARILFEKSLFDESFELLRYVILRAEKYENYNALHLASRLELEYLLALNFPNIDEKTLLKKQFKLNEILKYLRKVNEQSSLYEILKHRDIYKGHARSKKQKDDLNDLVYSEISIIASLNLENFEISKLHQLFQSNYLISVGDYMSALNSYYELNKLFEANTHLWNDPPIYYLHTLAGLLESLRGIRNYTGMDYFIGRLKQLETKSASFNINRTCITYLYELFPLLDRGDFVASKTLMCQYQNNLYEKLNSLNITHQAELCLYTSLIYFGNSDYKKAHKFLNQIILRGKNFYSFPLYRTIRLVNLMILYKLDDLELIRYEIRSIKRDLTGSEKAYKIERFMLKFFNKQLPLIAKKRFQYWNKIEDDLSEIQADVFERQILRIFDFTAWVESMVLKIPLQEILEARIVKKDDVNGTLNVRHGKTRSTTG
ncbi:MAG: hypothetical protein KKF98_06265 [Bacteroidetes bacterium]|nr:hypothetical protein [Bacteroidota bacterium]